MNVSWTIPGKARRKREEAQVGEALLDELEDLQLQLEAAQSQFDIVTDSEMIDACCFELKMLSTRYDHLLREARRRGLRNPPYGGKPSFQKEQNGV